MSWCYSSSVGPLWVYVYTTGSGSKIFAQVAAPIYRLFKKITVFEWAQEQTEAMDFTKAGTNKPPQPLFLLITLKEQVTLFLRLT